ncbi:hypothetical protein BABINDRAFT_9462 [Babjeviella inositovora NRRL Y-12698]|uniref:Splicing factor YJU2 n=1 Tax=Babjeviella inositovora NRRL Y-12698 TaxID=984486 RepID=A0A1E3QKK5_9ASCO|nr:uncharacterized protein BABINDRAFT_9462 [Babjeviella inositovora NRRL Y-12698]ODQ78239.1 hypothetical protein BABINDRAFT_9462 [Babjeviella inositovora NRRL Y-12698]
MSERKVINKYYPPDYDPAKVAKVKKPIKTGFAALPTVRLMIPFSMKCTKCLEYIARMKKFNARKETTKETYLGAKIYRFYLKCPQCYNEITFKTNPKDGNYLPDKGCIKLYESALEPSVEAQSKVESMDDILERLENEDKEDKNYKEEQKLRAKNSGMLPAPKLKDQEGDLMENMEARLDQQQHEQDVMDQLEEIQERNARVSANTEANVLQQMRSAVKESQIAVGQRDDEIAKLAFQTKSSAETPVSFRPKPFRVNKPSVLGLKKKGSALGVIVKRKA